MIKVSIIIPIYNMQLFLKECIDSAIDQTMGKEEYEIILIDNGSTDKSKEIAERYVNNYENVILVTYKKNRMFSAPINLGIHIARGKYISILHSDDIMKKELIERCYKISELNDLDIVRFAYEIFYDPNSNINFPSEDGAVIKSEKILKNKIYSGIEIFKIDSFLPTEFTLFIKKDFLIKNELFFNENLEFPVFEDFEFSPRLYLKIGRVIVIDDILYKYRIKYATGKGNELYNEIMKNSMNALIDIINREKIQDIDLVKSFKEYYIRGIFSLVNGISYVFKDDDELEKKFISALDEYISKYIEIFTDKVETEVYINISDVLNKVCINLGATKKYLIHKLKNNIQQFLNNGEMLLQKSKKDLLCRIPLLNKEKKVGIYGIGGHTESLLKFYQKNISDIKADLIFIDSFKGKNNELIYGRKIINVEDISHYKLDCILISSCSYEDKLYDKLQKYLKSDIEIFRLYEKEKHCLF